MADGSEHGIPRPVAIAWGMYEAPQRGPSRGLSHERIVQTAIEIADADGLDAVTMKRVAEALGFTAMSLYRYVANKDELLALMQDAASVPPEVKVWPPEGGWQHGLRVWASHLRDIYRAHPWLLEVPRTAVSVLMPHTMTGADRGLAVIADLAINEQDRVAVILNVSMMAMSYVELELDLAKAAELQFDAEGLELLSEVMTDQRLPFAAPLMLASTTAGPLGQEEDPESVEVEYDFGLDRFIEGLEALDARNRAE